MLAGKRALRVGDQILREMAHILAIKINDPRVQGVTLTGVELSDDLRYARVFYSVFDKESDLKKVQSGLDSAKGFFKREIGARVNLRYMPDIIFKHDPTLKTGTDMEMLFEKIKKDESSDSEV